ncbi:MAG: hypothetical protein JSU70_08205 [Phycisphaerales bacterium]|nr:MAG: hypothetical protein JSU70_08205 [Phycisphaerales bacterium]
MTSRLLNYASHAVGANDSTAGLADSAADCEYLKKASKVACCLVVAILGDPTSAIPSGESRRSSALSFSCAGQQGRMGFKKRYTVDAD